MTKRLGVHVFPTINFDAKTLHFCKQQQIVFSDTLVSNWLMAVWMTIRVGTLCHL